MKPKHILPGSTSSFQPGLIKAMAITLCLAGADQAMAQRTWTGGASPDANWNTAGNWSGGVMTGFVGQLNFSGNTQNSNNNNSTFTFGAINFVNDGSAGKTNGFILSGNDIILGAGINTTGSSIDITDTINNNLSLNGADRIFGLADKHHLLIKGIISGTGNALIKSQSTGNLTLEGANTYTGITNIRQGTVFVTQIADSGTSNIGFGNLQIGILGVAGNLSYSGSGSTTARTLQIGSGTAAGNSGGAIISATGSNGGTGLKFTATNFTTQDTGSITASRTLTLNGANTDANAINGVIANVRSGFTSTNLQKSDAGRWILGGNNSYTGSVTVSGGVLQLNHANAVSGGLGNTATVNTMTLNGGILGLGDGDLTRSLGAGAGQIAITSNNSGFAAYGADRIVNLGGAVTPTGVTWGAGSFFSGGTTTMVLSHATATHNLDFKNPINLNGANRTFLVNDGTAAVDATLSGAISGSGMGINKTGLGTLRVSNTNTSSYTGNTNVSAGTLIVDGNISTSLLTTVDSGATIAGSGTTGALTVSTGATIAPGNSPGILKVNGAYIQDGLYAAEINGLTAGTQHDQINVTGTVDIAGATLSTLFTGSYLLNDMIFILLNDDTDAITGTFTGLAQSATVTSYGGFNWEISYIANSGSSAFTGGNDIALRAIPEPRVALLGGLGLLMLFRRRNR